MTRIQLADWRDWRPIHTLRRVLPRPLEGGLYELLNWPIYHVHLASLDDEPVGFTSVVLWPDGAADDVGTVIAPPYRRQRIASELRATQVRDLTRMGWQRLYCAVPSDDPVAHACATMHFGEALGEVEWPGGAPYRYHGAPLSLVASRLVERGVKTPHPLSTKNDQKLQHKAERARADLNRLADLGVFNVQKATLRG
jgi:hypothetical protein